ncbi:MAG: 2-hydroxychromene-2-carboxylate isomerase [Hyphomonas sp.]|uniref:2-hydroxychromene-2-carboxylate isomerase n=1 Tax=Hyphomonas sp. TaxID=87 RepID=UPI00183F9191|nr:2-hydroxychromene-2-carboxylate isomerase [Hyphomonas sp.]MBU3919042.1 2-hydroxychromene-2-carboxylate isomerase [Alphaproteobacteria bacterium]MBA3069307.1 2-hydroxychromene-2-carboxylate isomerase [Hyphomonas sp.]MBU4063688.1 2-hydroxychromene-2-carboxylate isomerase [Alphaproteobacteria bacterium]MBU4164351.1 2-hydroxychromene-2-carboxylate isomerase [Alphaproteobacteria bacterium]MBU4569037.1 2-hydroxychromene-2-carboxylate isomerase [Alphaproteobacteria bacterium]
MIEFWFEFASTYSYPAAMRIEKVAGAAGLGVVWKPMLLGPLFNSQQGLKDSPFNAFPVKGKYMWRDLERTCIDEGLPLRRPDIFPQDGLKAARMVLALPDAARPDFVRAVYRANFVEGAIISDDSVLAGILARLGHSPEAVFAKAATDPVKAELKKNTEEAAARGVFGAPTFFAPDGEMFWGNDRLEQAVRWARKVKNQSIDTKVDAS